MHLNMGPFLRVNCKRIEYVKHPALVRICPVACDDFRALFSDSLLLTIGSGWHVWGERYERWYQPGRGGGGRRRGERLYSGMILEMFSVCGWCVEVATGTQ